MPTIKPTSAKDCIEFIKKHESDIENGTYKVLIEENWIPNLSEETIAFLLRHSKLGNDVLIASSRFTPISILELLAKDKNPLIRRAIAKSLNTPKSLLEQLAKDNVSDVLIEVAKNPNTQSLVLEALAKNSDPNIRSEAASHPDTPVALLETLSRDKENRVRAAIARNPSTPKSIIDILTRDTDYKVREALESSKTLNSQRRCYIATAVYGSSLAPELKYLYNFRDNVLHTTIMGRLFVFLYYLFSPPVSKLISKNEKLKFLVRFFIVKPCIQIAKKFQM